MAKKSKGRQRITMAKMENESNLQVTFSKRRSGLFKKASELNTLCGADITVIVFSPGGKVYSFGHPTVEVVLNRFLNINQSLPNQNNNMRLNEVRPNIAIRVMNDLLTQVMSDLESARKKNEELKKIRKNSKMPERWWEEPVEELDLDHAKDFKGKLEELKKLVTDEASKHFQTIFPPQNFYVGSSSGAPFRDGGYINPNLDPCDQRRVFNANAYYNQPMYLPNYQLPYGNNNYAGGFVPEYNLNFMHAGGFNQYQNLNQNLSFKEEGISENECHQEGHPPHR
ncbi:hypothetical protein N665_0198s0064 [Sinapis alba]|nr:hypothetical protein N665_0198s0064 [Sinapis alba]